MNASWGKITGGVLVVLFLANLVKNVGQKVTYDSNDTAQTVVKEIKKYIYLENNGV